MFWYKFSLFIYNYCINIYLVCTSYTIPSFTNYCYTKINNNKTCKVLYSFLYRVIFPYFTDNCFITRGHYIYLCCTPCWFLVQHRLCIIFPEITSVSRRLAVFGIWLFIIECLVTAFAIDHCFPGVNLFVLVQFRAFVETLSTDIAAMWFITYMFIHVVL